MDKPADAIAYQEASIDIDASPEAVYGLVSDLARMGEWSPESTGGAWRDGATGKAGDWFDGTNRAGDFEWTREVQVARAEPGRDFTFVAGGVENNRTWWSYEMAPTDTGTRLTEKWWVVNKPPAWVERSHEAFLERAEQTLGAIQATLAAVKHTAESRRD
ncbi:MAG: SRPBCC family protein [Acidimicrobiales bacterium]